MLAALLEFVSGLWAPTNPQTQLASDTRKRANRAYAAAWTTRNGEGTTDELRLLHEMQSRNVPGSFSDAANDPMLSFYFERWRAGDDPKTVRTISKQSR